MAKRGGFPGGAMPGNMNNLMKQAQRMQRQMEESQKELETKEFTAKAGGGVVEVTVTGKKEVTKVKISEEAVDPDDVEMLQKIKAELEENGNLAVSSSFINNLEVTDIKAQKGPILKEYIEYAVSNDYGYFIAGGALGVDTLFALTVIELKEKHPLEQMF